MCTVGGEWGKLTCQSRGLILICQNKSWEVENIVLKHVITKGQIQNTETLLNCVTVRTGRTVTRGEQVLSHSTELCDCENRPYSDRGEQVLSHSTELCDRENRPYSDRGEQVLSHSTELCDCENRLYSDTR
jgi:hypothetical protein